jgi:ribosomal protein S6--L-glutamate ligase
MKIAILSRAPGSYSTRRLVAAAEGRGHEVDIIDVLKLDISLEHGYPDLYYRGRSLPEYDAAIPRIGSSITFFGTAAVRQLEQMDVFCSNSAVGIANSRDKLRCLQMLSKHADVGIPATEFVRREQDILPAIERVGGVPVVIKLLEGTQGIGVILAESLKVAESVIETLHSANQNVLIQKFVAESRGKDIRAFVVGDRVVAAARRTAQAGEFRSNIHRGGKAEAVQLDSQYEAAAVKAAQVVGLRVAGVDLLEGKDGPAVMEVNSTPGLQGIETATGIDVAGAIIDYVRYHVRLPDLDLRQRLTVSRGYGVAEIPVREGSGLEGKTIETCGLRDRDVLILTVHREGKVIPNPRGGRELEVGDRLLCFGRLETMRTFVPQIKLPRVRKLPAKPMNGDAGR